MTALDFWQDTLVGRPLRSDMDNRLKRVDESERRRRRMYALIDKAWAVEKMQARRVVERGGEARYVEPFVREGGPLPWKYLTPRVVRMLGRRELSNRQAKAAALYVYFSQLNWLTWSTGTNFPKGEKLSGGRYVHNVTPGASIRIEALDVRKKAILDAALLGGVAFKDLPHINGTNRLARHRSGRRFFIDAIDAFAAILTR